MGLFSREPMLCPICQQDLAKVDSRMSHWIRHVTLIESGEGSGSYTWRCTCGPADMYWPNRGSARAGLAVHMSDKHQIGIT